MKRVKFTVGDVFRFAESPEGWGYGQILRSDILQYIVIFEPKFKGDYRLDDVVSSTFILSGWTMDARFYSGDWIIVGNVPARKFSFPEYKVEIAGKIWVTDVEGNPLRIATAREARNLAFETSNSPIAFENAFKAHHGDLPWDDRFTELLCQEISRTSI